MLSRGLSPHAISKSELWWRGPHWLKNAESEWPVTTTSLARDIPERRNTAIINVAASKPRFQIFERFSSYSKLIRVFAVCLRFVNMTRKKGVGSAKTSQHGSNKGEFLPLFVSELEAAKLTLVKIVQRECFQNDIQHISSFGAVNKRSSILKLNPFLDASGILRVGGRLRHANLSYNAKHPMLIPAQHRFTRLITMHEYCRLFHAGAQLTLASIR